ncbi:hypothetical protein [Pedobacter heparinus]|uniref:hypothetical protein n=1 Tax=Pedobacter heparinus TaxID=984 RepID=UPI002930DFA7|nr:hypothetical protein [Pedobacter heparinus]
MKKFLVLLSFCYGLTAFGQTDVPLNVPGIGHGASVNDSNYRFNYSGLPVGHYALGWYDEGLGSPVAYLSAHAGLRFFTAGIPRINIAFNGNVGIGTTAPIGKLDVRGNLFIGTTDLSIGSVGSFIQMDQGAASGDTYSQIRAFSNGGNTLNNLILQNSGGDVGIGTTDPKGYKLAVNGKIRALEIKVEASPWPDYVFAKDYQLPTLQQTEQHIKENGHLPGIPSAAEVKTNGIDVGEMNAKLLQKIEELTLYLIDMKKDAEHYKDQFNKLQLEVTELKTKSLKK